VDAVALLKSQIEDPAHVFWPNDISIVDSEIFDHSRLLGPNRIGDAYLLALAVKHGGRFVTFDRSVPRSAVRGAEPRHIVML